MKAKHAAFWGQISGGKSPSITKYVHAKPEWKQGGKKATENYRYLARFVVSGNLPLQIVENPWLQKFVKEGYILPGRTYLGKNILEPMMLETKLCVSQKNYNVLSVGLQIDHYTSSAHYPYGNIHATYISDDFEVVNLSLGTFSFERSHTGENIFDSVEGPDGFVQEYNLRGMTRTYTTDNASNCKAAFDGKDNIEWIACFAHTLHLVVKAGLKVDEVR